MLAIVTFALSVTICLITTFNLPIYQILSLIFHHYKAGQSHELQRRRIGRWMAILWLTDGEKWWIYLKPFSCGPPIHTHTHTHVHKHKPTIAIGENATHCICLKILTKQAICNYLKQFH